MKAEYDKTLMTPMQPRVIGHLSSEEERNEKNRAWADEDMGNLNRLCVHYGIKDDPYKFYLLALALARETIPCFKVKVKEGRPKKWTEFALGMLAVEIERVTSTGTSIDQAAAVLARKAPWNTMLEQWGEDAASFGPDPVEALKKAYKTGKGSKITKLHRDAYQYHDMTGTTDEWDSMVLELKEKTKI